jgi:hypothetical protein
VFSLKNLSNNSKLGNTASVILSEVSSRERSRMDLGQLHAFSVEPVPDSGSAKRSIVDGAVTINYETRHYSRHVQR